MHTLTADTEPQGDFKLNYLLDTSRCWSFLKKKSRLKKFTFFGQNT